MHFFCIYFRGWKFYNPSWWFIFTDGEVLISRGLIFAVGKYVIFMSSMILAGWETNFERISEDAQCVKSVRIRSFSGPYFPAFWLNRERYGVSLCIQSKCREIWAIKTPNMETFYTVTCVYINHKTEKNMTQQQWLQLKMKLV